MSEKKKDWKAAANTLRVQDDGKGEARQGAECAVSSVTSNAVTARLFSHGTFGLSDLTECVAVVRGKTEKVLSGDISDIEATLTAQAVALNSIFSEMARRAAMNMGEHLQAADMYMKNALKAQAQCRSTLETLAEIKNPRQVAFVKQANISQGHQQVNNGVSGAVRTEAHAHGNNPIQSNELSGAGNELLPDARASQVTSRANQEVETVGEIYRGAN